MNAIPFCTLKLAGRIEDGGAELATKNDIIQLEQRVTIRVGGMLVVAMGILLAAVRYLPSHS